MNPCDREGIFRGKIESFGLRDTDQSQSVGVTIQVRLLEMWQGEAWEEWSQYDMQATGDLWIIKKDGTPNENAVRSLVEFAGWDGSIDSITNGTWVPTKCQVVVKPDVYKGQTRYRIEFVNNFDRVPGAISSVTPDKARELSARHGSALRAIAGNAKRNGTPPATAKPAAPPPPQKGPLPVGGEGIPF